MNAGVVLGWVLLGCSAIGVTGSGAGGAGAPPDPIPFDPVGFSRGTLLIDRALHEHGAAFVECLDRFDASLRARRASLATLRTDGAALVAEVNTLLGREPGEVLAERQQTVVVGLTLLAGSVAFPETDDARIWIVERERGKAYVRGGGSLPGVVHDPRTGDVSLAFAAAGQQATEVFLGDDTPPPLLELDQLTIPVDAADPVASLDGLLSAIGQFAGDSDLPIVGAIAHEVAELSLLDVIRPSDAHWRWFSDGFATAVAEEALRRIGRADDARMLAGTYDATRYEALRSAALLRYWPAPDYAPDLPFAAERRLTQARYAFAAEEARRAMREHGVDTVARLVEDLARRPANSAADLIAAASTVTGEDFAARLDAYQPFRAPEEGAPLFQEQLAAAQGERDAEAVTIALTRLLELRLSSDYPPRLYALVGLGLIETGHPEEALSLMRRQAVLSARYGEPAQHEMIDMLIVVAVRADRPGAAHGIVDAALTAKPGDLAALAVRAHRLAAEGRASPAAALARRLIDRAPRQTPAVLSALLARLAAGDDASVWREITTTVEPARDAVAGNWHVRDGRIGITGAPFARLALPVTPPASYELDVVFWRHSGRESLNLVLPVAGRQTLLVLDGWPALGGITALDLVDGQHGDDNVTTNRSFRMAGRVTHTLYVAVAAEDDRARITVTIDGVEYIDWAGPVAALSLDERWALPDRAAIGLGAYGVPAVFQSVRLRAGDPAPDSATETGRNP